MTPRARAILATASTANLAANLLFPVLAVRALGVSDAADALFMAFILPSVVMVLLGNSVLNWSTPRLVRRADDASRRVLCWSLLWTLLSVVSAGCALLWVAAGMALPRVAPGSGYALAISVLPFALLAVLATVVATLAQSLFTAERDVPGGEWRTLVANTLVGLLWFVIAPATLLSCALLFALRPVCTALMLAPRLGAPRRPDFGDADLRDVLRESRLLLVAATYYKSEPFIDRLLFATVPGGAVAAFHVAQQMVGTVSLLMNRMVTAPMVAPLASRVHAGDVAGVHRLLRSALWRVGLVGVLAWLLFALAGEALVGLLFAGTTLAPAQVTLTAQMLVALGGYLLAILCGQVLAQAYYCSGGTRLMVMLGVAGFTLGLLLKVLALWQFGVLGLAAATSLSWLLNTTLMRVFVPKTLQRITVIDGRLWVGDPASPVPRESCTHE